jgi:very-short-patch-repair endonuclease
MSRIVQVDGISRWEKNSGYYGWRSKINKKTIDYVLFSKPYYQPVLCIEYDGKSHNKSDRKARDREVDAIFSTACLPILHVKHKITTKREILDFISDVLS